MMAKFLEENGCGFEGPGLKTGMVNDIFRSEIGQDLRELGGTLSSETPRSTRSAPSSQMRGF